MRCSLVLVSLCAFAATAHASSYSSALSQALDMCAALAPGHESELGNVDPGEVSYWFHKARFEASRKFWSPRGIRFLEAQLQGSTDDLKSVCIRQLIEEAQVKDEVPPNYSLKRTAASRHGVD
jgi:hypothetical protein